MTELYVNSFVIQLFQFTKKNFENLRNVTNGYKVLLFTCVNFCSGKSWKTKFEDLSIITVNCKHFLQNVHSNEADRRLMIYFLNFQEDIM